MIYPFLCLSEVLLLLTLRSNMSIRRRSIEYAARSSSHFLILESRLHFRRDKLSYVLRKALRFLLLKDIILHENPHVALVRTDIALSVA